MGNCVSRGERAKATGEPLGRQHGCDDGQAVSAFQIKPPAQPPGLTGGAEFLDKSARNGAQLLLTRTSSLPSAPNSPCPSSVEKHCTLSPTLPAGTPRCPSSTTSCKPPLEAHQEETHEEAPFPSPLPSPFCSSRATMPSSLPSPVCSTREALQILLPERDSMKLFASWQSSLASPAFPSPLSTPHRSSLPTTCRRGPAPRGRSKTFAVQRPLRPREKSKTFNNGSLPSDPASCSHTPSPAAPTPWTPKVSKAATTSTDTASLTSKAESQDQPCTPGPCTDLRRWAGVGDSPHSPASLNPALGSPQHSSQLDAAHLDPCSVEASPACMPPSSFAQQWPAEGKKAGCCRRSLAEDASLEDWRSVHMAMTVAAELGEDVPLPCEDEPSILPSNHLTTLATVQPPMPPSDGFSAIHAMKTEEASTNSTLLSVGKEGAHTTAQPCVRSSRHSVPCYADQGSSRPFHMGSAPSTPGGQSSHFNSSSRSSARRSPALNTLARLSKVLARPFLDSLQQPHSPRSGPGKPAPPKPRAQDTQLGSSHRTTSSISDPQVTLARALSSSMYVSCEGCSNSHNECSLPNKSTAQPLPQQQQQQMEYGFDHTHPDGVGPNIIGVHNRASAPEAARDGHECFALQSFFSPMHLS